MLGLVLTLTLAAPTSPRLLYEQKCLYCHSEEVTERRRRTEAEWRKLVEQMREKAPLLVTRSDAVAITRYLSRVLASPAPAGAAPVATPARPARPPATTSGPSTPASPPAVASPVPAPPPALVPAPLPAPLVPVPEADPTAALEPWPGQSQATQEELERARAAEQAAFALMERRCSRCHTLGRVYGKLDTLSRSLATIERMRFKTGSGITQAEMKLLQDFVRAQFAE